MSTISSYVDPREGDLLLEIRIKRDDVLNLIFNDPQDPELDTVRRVTYGDSTPTELLAAVVILLKKIEKANKDG